MRNKLKVGLIIVVTAVMAIQGWALASDRFDDVPDANPFHDDIGWLADAGVTLGCGGDAFCPGDSVTREQMAAFMRRLSEAAVVDAGTLDGQDSGDFLAASERETILARTPVAMAWVEGGGTLGRDFGFTAITNATTGIYCLQLDPALGLTDADVVAQVSVEWGDSSGSDLLAYWHEGGCASDEISVRTFDNLATPTLTNDVAFSVTVYLAGGVPAGEGAPTPADAGNTVTTNNESIGG